MTAALVRSTIPAFVKRLLVREVASSSLAHRLRMSRSREDDCMVHNCRGLFFVGLAALTLSIASAGAARAQDAVVRGKIISDRGEPVSGASVVVEELRLSATTNATGEYSLGVPGARVRRQPGGVRARRSGFRPNSQSGALAAGAPALALSPRD